MLTHESGIFNECCKMQNPVICSLTQARSSWEDYTASRICKCLCLTKQKCWFWVSFLRNLIWAFGEWCQERNENSLRKDLGQRRRKSMKKVLACLLSKLSIILYLTALQISIRLSASLADRIIINSSQVFRQKDFLQTIIFVTYSQIKFHYNLPT